MTLAAQTLYLTDRPRDQLGSLFQHFAETTIGNAFRPESILGENRFIFDQFIEPVLKLYRLLDSLSLSVFKFLEGVAESGLALNEIPVLLDSPNRETSHQYFRTTREKISKKISYSNLAIWQQAALPNVTTPISLTWTEPFFWQLLSGNGGVVPIMRRLKLFLRDLQNPHAGENETFAVHQSLGMNEIMVAEEANHFGNLLAPRLRSLMFIMKHSKVLPNVDISFDLQLLRAIALQTGFRLREHGSKFDCKDLRFSPGECSNTNNLELPERLEHLYLPSSQRQI